MLELFYVGGRHRVYRLVLASGRSPVDEYLESLTERDQDKMLALIQSAADNGPPFHNRERCKPVEGYKFFEFKLHGPRVIWCWLPDRSIALLHGFTKRQDRIPERELGVGGARYDQAQQDFPRRGS